MDFSSAYFVDKVTGIMMRKDTSGKVINIWVFINIFDCYTWRCLIIAFFILTLSLTLVSIENGSSGQALLACIIEKASTIGLVLIHIGTDHKVGTIFGLKQS